MVGLCLAAWAGANGLDNDPILAVGDDGTLYINTSSRVVVNGIDIIEQLQQVRATQQRYEANFDIIFRSDPGSAWVPPSQRVITIEANGARAVTAVDLDGDGYCDVLSASSGDAKIAWSRNLGNGTFASQSVITREALGAMSVFAVDIDGDDHIDVVSASSTDHKVAWYRNFGNGTFSGQKVITQAATNAKAVYAADLDGDGDMDVLSASAASPSVAWYRNNGSGDFGTPLGIMPSSIDIACVVAVDINGDTFPDVLVLSAETGMLAWFANQGDASFGPQSTIAQSGNYGYALHGDGTFSSGILLSNALDTVRGVSAADLDNDGHVDVLSASYSDDKIAWYRNDGMWGYFARYL
ncbi:uncharacterized protein MONBRDRAFT_12719 [Monosiga brevicollis MX1]|uniref:VCBS repeat-containing protein n=1 Tax=Monosiga brevicollis TaxID=81824 RepID=A9VD44_MONBE|nr:uncharacterized protein MONBRDRAFT_12719 [Monosiga brevicollis MX1]EDQ84615.1 predicted protein [Monosiga brevicollis MX1]|eukprot:XP_001750642.1 hypothetical protein [Monosiga brevicollis MX1]